MEIKKKNKGGRPKKKSTIERFDEALEIAQDEIEQFQDDDDVPFPIVKVEEPKSLAIIEPVTTQEVVPVIDNPIDHLSKDYVKTRNTLSSLVDKGTEAIDMIMSFAAEGESARTFEVLGQMIKVTSEVAKDLVALQKNMIEIQKLKLTSDETGNNPNSNNTTVNSQQTIVLTGTTESALQKLRQLSGGNS